MKYKVEQCDAGNKVPSRPHLKVDRGRYCIRAIREATDNN